jgi:hypothetical protein
MLATIVKIRRSKKKQVCMPDIKVYIAKYKIIRPVDRCEPAFFSGGMCCT